jgi:hypothetical protein
MDFFGAQDPSYDSNMLPKVVFDKTAFVKFKYSGTVMNLILFFVISITEHNPMFIEEYCIGKSGLL